MPPPIRLCGYVRDPLRPSTRRPLPLPGAASPSARSADLRPFAPPVLNQGGTLSCTGHAAKVIVDVALRRAGLNEPSSARGLYGLGLYALTPPGSPLVDGGAHFRSIFEQAKQFGIPREADCPWDERRVTDDLGFDTLVNGQGGLLPLEDWYTIPTWPEAAADGLDPRSAPMLQVEAALDQGFAVGGAWAVTERFVALTDSTYHVDTDRSAVAGLHAMAILAYADGLYLLRNSWGLDWAMNGEVWVDKSYLAQGFDFVAVKAVPEETP